MENVVISEAEQQQIEAEEQQVQERIAESKASNGLRKIITQTQSKARFDTGLNEEEPAEDTEEPTAEETEESEETAEQPTGEAESPEAAEQEETEESTEEETAAASGTPDWMRTQLEESGLEVDPNDPEAVQKTFSQLIADQKALAQEREANKVVYDLFENSDELVEVAKHMNKGDSFMVALARAVDLDKAQQELKCDDPEEYKKMLRAQVEREAELEKAEKEREKMEQEYEENTAQSLENMDSFFEEKGMDPDKQEDFKKRVDNHLADLLYGKVTPEFLEVLHKGLNYEVDLEAAKEKGKLEGKNEKIKATRTKKAGDGLPITRNGSTRSKEESKASDGKRALASLVANNRSTFG